MHIHPVVLQLNVRESDTTNAIEYFELDHLFGLLLDFFRYPQLRHIFYLRRIPIKLSVA